jgi:hypothetical protein
MRSVPLALEHTGLAGGHLGRVLLSETFVT